MFSSTLPPGAKELSSTPLIDLAIQQLLDEKNDVLRATPSRESRDIRCHHNRTNNFVTMLTQYECMVATVAFLGKTDLKALVCSCTLLRDTFKMDDKDSNINWRNKVSQPDYSSEKQAKSERVMQIVAKVVKDKEVKRSLEMLLIYNRGL